MTGTVPAQGQLWLRGSSSDDREILLRNRLVVTQVLLNATLNSGDVCYHSLHRHLSSSFLLENVIIEL